MAGKKSDLGPIGENVMHTVRDLRENRHLTYAELSRRLSDLGRDIPPLGLRRIESGDRKVDVDDVVAIAFVLNVSPLALLLPTADGPIAANGKEYNAEDIWNWARGGFPLTDHQQSDAAEWLAYVQPSNPFTDFTEAFARIQDLGYAPGKKRPSDGDGQ